jgi:peptide/nickel transport system ATP-binding protein/oligopeptide transport system ATP-binding protein
MTTEVDPGATGRPAGDGAASRDGPLLEIEGLVKDFPIRGGLLRRTVANVSAVAGLDVAVHRGETFSLVGESGCGKSTTGRCILRLQEPTGGSIRFDGVDVVGASSRDLRRLRRRMQIVYQDPYASLNPRLTVGGIISDPMRVHGLWSDGGPERVGALLERVGLSPSHVNRYPHEFSGGQRQRIGIARALALEPELLVLDEPVSALDVSIRAGVVNLLADLQAELGLTYLFIAHDLAVVRHVSDQVAVMYLGKIVEQGPSDEVYEHASHPYTQALLSAVPVPDPKVERKRKRILLEGDVPSPVNPPSGCRFRTRCWKAQQRCAEEEPALVDRGQGHPVACHFADEAPSGVIP